VVNWTAVGVGFVVTLILGIIGLYVPFLGLLAPIIGGLVAAYMAGGKYIDGIVNGGLAGGIAGFITALIGFALIGAAVSVLTGYAGAGAVIAIIGAITGFIIGAILGLVGGVIGIAIKGKPAEQPMTEPAPVARESPNIEFSMENIQKCICSTCPVQEESECVKEKLKMMQEMMQSEEKMMPNPEDVPGLYCATGKATCEGLDTEKMCNCVNCPIWAENDLANGKPMGYFCRDGKAM